MREFCQHLPLGYSVNYSSLGSHCSPCFQKNRLSFHWWSRQKGTCQAGIRSCIQRGCGQKTDSSTSIWNSRTWHAISSRLYVTIRVSGYDLHNFCPNYAHISKFEPQKNLKNSSLVSFFCCHRSACNGHQPWHLFSTEHPRSCLNSRCICLASLSAR